MAMNNEQHPRSDIYRLYVFRTEGRRELIGCKMWAKAKENSFGWYIEHHIESLIVAVRIRNTVPSKNFTQPKEFKKQDNEERINNWKGNAIYG